MMQLYNKRKIFNINKKLGENTNKLGYHKKKYKDKRNKLKWTLLRIRSNKFLKINKLQNPQWNTQMNKNVSIRHIKILKFLLIPRPHHPYTTRCKHLWMTHMIQVKGKKPTKPVTSTNKSSKFTAKHKYDNEEKSLKQNHQDASILKQEFFFIIILVFSRKFG